MTAFAYTDEGADSNGPMFAAGATQYYRIRAVNSVGTGPPSDVAVATSGMCHDVLTGIPVSDPFSNPGLVSDCELLLAVRDTLAGTGTLNWSSDLAITAWEGVTVDGTPRRVTGLELPISNLTGPIPAELGDLTSLEYLDLWGNQLTGPIPVELETLANLQHLDLSLNELTGGIPAELGTLASLQHLDLLFNELTGQIPPELGTLTSLQHLDLSSNELTGPIPVELGNLTNLEQLVLWGNQLTGPIPVELETLANLQTP